MHAFGITGYKQPLAPIDVPEPVIGPRDVLVDAEAAGLNHLDEKMRAGEFRAILRVAMPLVLGYDVAGTVLKVGDQVRDFAPGDRVFGRPAAGGTFTERVAVPEDELALVPAVLSTAQAGGLPLVALTAWQALVEQGHLRAGQKVLIHAGAGAVGSLAIQLAKHLGASVATTASGTGIDLARELGADVVVDYRTQDFEAALSGYDLVLDSLGGENLTRSLRVLRPGGKAIGIAGPPEPAFARQAGLNPALRLAIAALSSKVRRHAKKLGVTYEFLFMHASGDQLQQISALLQDGTLRPLSVETFPVEQTPEALAGLAAGRIRGKAVITRD